MTPGETPAARPSLEELARLGGIFLRLGVISFGGPAGHIAMMEDELVRRRGWVTREKFLDLVGAVNLLPGPNSTELAFYLGLLRAGWAGFLVAGTAFILPAAILVAALAWAYVRYGMLPQAAALLYGTKPVIIAVVAQALWGLGRTAVRTIFLAALGIAVVVASFLGVNPVLLLFSTGAIVALGRLFLERPPSHSSLSGLLVGAAALPTGAAGAAAVGVWSLFFYFLKVGAVLFGSGYLLIALLRADLVERWHWLTEAQLLDAIAVSQVTPGPLSTAATFIGYLLAGPWGALLATIGIFLPGFVIVGASGRLIPRLRQSRLAGAFLDGVNVGAVALMAVVSWQLGRAALVDIPTTAIAIASGVLLLRFRVNSAWLVLGGALAGFAISVLRAH
ncbi:MAG: chromate efflux transporter [Candidatus Acidiferrales bacterium]